MVKKLLKYELGSYMRPMIPTYIIVLALAVACRVIQFFESPSVAYSIAFGSSVFGVYVGIMVCFVMSTIISVVRYYRNFFTAEGYLTFTLPVTSAQHIFVKLVGAVIFILASLATVTVAFVTVTSGDMLVELCKAGAYLVKLLFREETELAIHFVFYAFEGLILIALSQICALLIYYTCISIGQRARKNRVLMAVLVYFGYYIAMQILTTVLMIVFTVLELAGAFDGLFAWIGNHMLAFVHLAFCGGIIFSLAFAVLLFFINKRIIDRKLNLE